MMMLTYAATPGDQTTEGGSALYLLDGSYLDDAGYLHVPDGSLTLRVKNYKGSLQRIFLNLDFLYNQPVLAEVFARDEGNCYPYSLGDGRILLQSVPENRYLKVYPYGKVSDFYIRIQTADASGNAAAGSYGELVVKYHGLSANGTIPFHFRAGVHIFFPILHRARQFDFSGHVVGGHAGFRIQLADRIRADAAARLNTDAQFPICEKSANFSSNASCIPILSKTSANSFCVSALNFGRRSSIWTSVSLSPRPSRWRRLSWKWCIWVRSPLRTWSVLWRRWPRGTMPWWRRLTVIRNILQIHIRKVFA